MSWGAAEIWPGPWGREREREELSPCLVSPGARSSGTPGPGSGIKTLVLALRRLRGVRAAGKGLGLR